MTLPRQDPLPSLRELFLRHRGLYEHLSRAYADAAAICLGEHHVSPTDLEIHCDSSRCLREVRWEEPEAGARESWGNRDDTTRDAAYSVGLAAVEAELGFVALARADTRTGADYFAGTQDTTLETAHRLEVSGTRAGDERGLRARLTQKVDQAQRGLSDLPALACVVGFQSRAVLLARIDSDA
jgi:hypothetical protein